MRLQEMATATLTPVVQKMANRTFTVMKKEVKPYGPASASMNVLSPTKVEYVFEFQRWMQPTSITQLYADIEMSVRIADKEGYVLAAEVGNGVGADFVEALLQGLRPGMKSVNVEAFFPTIAFEVTWKNIMKK